VEAKTREQIEWEIFNDSDSDSKEKEKERVRVSKVYRRPGKRRSQNPLELH